MKIYTIVLCLFCCFAVPLSAQTIEPIFKLGTKTQNVKKAKKQKSSTKKEDVFPTFTKENNNLDLSNWIQANLNPKLDSTAKKGRVTLNFYVNANKSTSDFVIENSLEPKSDSILLSVCKSMPRWYKAGIQNGKPTRVKVSVPVKINTEM